MIHLYDLPIGTLFLTYTGKKGRVMKKTKNDTFIQFEGENNIINAVNFYVFVIK